MSTTQDFLLILASQSAQRALLLRQLGLPFEQKSLTDLNVDDVESLEMELPQELPADYVSRVAQQKWLAAQRVLAHSQSTLLLTADTTVSFENTILHKPENTQQAYEMIRVLSGQTHDVRTAICVGWCAGQSPVLKICHSRVRFMPLTHAQCLAYAQSGEGLGRAGGYAIQGKAAMWIEQIEGSYSSIMGLPLFETAQALEQLGVKLI
jgi:septum formation protein